MQPLVSVVMPAYNAADTLSAAVQSVRCQSLADWELIIVDDGSTDGTAELADRLSQVDDRIRLVSMPVASGGPAAPRNRAMAVARGRFIAFLDADDLWLPRKLEVQTRAMLSRNAAVSCTGYYAFTEQDTSAPGKEADDIRLGELLPPERADYSRLLKANTAGCLTVMLDSSVAGPVVFPECGHEDYALWLDLLRGGHVMHGIPEVLAGYRVSRNSVSGRKWRNLGYFWHIYRRREHFGRLKSLLLCLRYATGALRKYAV